MSRFDNPTREKMWQVRVSPEQDALAKKLASMRGLTLSQMVRALVADEISTFLTSVEEQQVYESK